MKNIKFAAVPLFASMLLAAAGPAMAKCYVDGQEISCDIFWAKYGWIFVVCFLIPGLIFLVKPDWHIKFIIWSQRVFMGAKYIPSKKTEIVIRAVGAIFAALGLVFFYLAIR